MNNKLLEKFSNNKYLLYIIPNLIYIIFLLNIYNTNFNITNLYEVLFREIVILSIIFFIITNIIHLFLNKALGNKHKVFLCLCYFNMFYFTKLSLLSFLIFILLYLVIIFCIKKFVIFKLDSIVVLISFIVIILFCYQFVITCYNLGYYFFHLEGYNESIDVVVDETLDSPNIYYIHCDAMMSIDTIEKYFIYKSDSLVNYLESNNFYINKDATLIVGHHTLPALVSIFNPNYYDNFFKSYLTSLEDSFYNEDNNPSMFVSYDELMDRKNNNEVIESLKKKGYTTISISEFNQYSYMNTDYFYDYFNYNANMRKVVDGENEFRLVNKENNSTFTLSSYSYFTHFKYVLQMTLLYDIMSDVNYLNYEEVFYDDMDLSNYETLNNTTYWVSQAIVKGISDGLEIDDSSKFFFIDFPINHLPLTYNRYGNLINSKNEYNLSYYLDNYIYSNYLLIDILSYIMDNDEEAIIILEGDHGIHMLENDYIMEYFNIDMDGVMEIRNSVISAIYIPSKYKEIDLDILDNPLNIMRYIVNNYVGYNYNYIE